MVTGKEYYLWFINVAVTKLRIALKDVEDGRTKEAREIINQVLVNLKGLLPDEEIKQ